MNGNPLNPAQLAHQFIDPNGPAAVLNRPLQAALGNINVNDIPARFLEEALMRLGQAAGLIRNNVISRSAWDDLAPAARNVFLNNVENEAQVAFNNARTTYIERIIDLIANLPVTILDNKGKVAAGTGAAILAYATLATMYPEQTDAVFQKVKDTLSRVRNEFTKLHPMKLVHDILNPTEEVNNVLHNAIGRIWYGTKPIYPVDVMIETPPFTEEPPEPLTAIERKHLGMFGIDYPGEPYPENIQYIADKQKNITDYEARKASHVTHVPGKGPGPATLEQITNPPTAINWPEVKAGKKEKVLSSWQKHVAEYAKKHNINYFQALTKAKASYKK